jgi:intracellular sulfur oxidation DsrE/DsrF family protein
MSLTTHRRTILQSFGCVIAAGAAALALPAAKAAPETKDLLPAGAAALAELTQRLAKAPRRRQFKTVPMILNSRDQWDYEAFSEVLAYRPSTKQVWDNTDIGGSWLRVMRNSLNAQIWSFQHPDFLAVSETHGSAQLALYDQSMWDKYNLAKLAGAGFERNTLIVEQPAASADPANYEDPAGVYSDENNSIPALQRRGVVFMSCHNAIWEQATKLRSIGANPDNSTVDVIAAELTNHLIPGVVLTPGAVGSMPELQQAGFHYAR